jgi:PhzF family phenazine biosynthesis protein
MEAWSVSMTVNDRADAAHGTVTVAQRLDRYRAFSGNPAGICFLDSWLSDSVMQSIAAENNLPETAFLVRNGDDYELRWFTPAVEVELCGHATLASAFAVFTYVNPSRQSVGFQTKSGLLSVERQGELLVLDFPATNPVSCPWPDGIGEALGQTPSEILRSRDLLVVFDSEEQIRNLKLDMARIAALDCFAIIVTTPGKECDYVSRFFAPRQGIRGR